MISYAAHLRVYEPLTALPEDEQDRWRAYVASGAAPDRIAGVEQEHAAALAALLAVPVRLPPPPEVEHAFVRVEGGVTHVCPWRTRLRCLVALTEFRDGLPEPLADAFVPRPVAEAAARELSRLQARRPQLRPSILTSTWQVPLPWFVPFEAHERRLVLGERRFSGGQARTELDRALVYVTTMARARQRVARALHVLRRTLEEGPAVLGVEDLGRWLEEFHPHALVELDYGGLVHLLDDEELADDDSVAVVAASLGALSRGDTQGAALGYEQVTSRWRAVAAMESAN